MPSLMERRLLERINDLERRVSALETQEVNPQYLIVRDGITAPGSANGYAKIYVDTADGDLKIKFGDNTVKTIVADT